MNDIMFIIFLMFLYVIIMMISEKLLNDMGGFIATLSIIVLFVLNYYSSKIIKVKEKDYNISPILVNSKNKNFFLGIGFIDSKEYYLANVQKGNNIERIYIPVENTIRIIDKNLTNFAIYKEYYCIRKGLFTKSDIDVCYNFFKSNIKNKLIIPKNTIVKQIN